MARAVEEAVAVPVAASTTFDLAGIGKTERARIRVRTMEEERPRRRMALKDLI